MNRKSFLTLAAFFCVPLIAAAQGGPAGPWNLTFSDEFNGTALDTTKWATQYTWGCHNNDEQECYQAANVTVSNGSAHLTAQKQTVTSGGTTYSYTSGMIQNSKAFSQTYGYFEMRAKIPGGQGFWPAFWTLPSNGNWPPEIDAIELGKSGDFTTARMTLHWGTNGSDNYQENDWTNTGTAFAGNYHVYAVDWEPGVVTWYIDGVQRAKMTTSNSPTIPMYILANLAVGGSWPGNVNSSTPLPSSMDIDYIRAWTKSSSGCYAAIPAPTDAIPSTTCSGSTDTQAPTTPTNLTTSVVSSSQINLSWTASTDNVAVTGYKVYRNGSQVGTATGTTYQDTGLSASTTYSYTVAAYDAAGNTSAQTSAVNATTSAAVTTTAPSITSFAASSSSIASGQSVTLSWTVTGSPTPTLTLNGTTVTGSSTSVSPTSTTTYTLAATNSAGSTSAQTTVTVTAASGGSTGNGTSGSGTTTTSSGAPSIFFTDLDSGPNTGGENNNGAYVTIYGNNFGSSPTVTVGGGQALIKLAPSAYLWYQKMTIQLGASAQSGNIVVTNSNGSSNGVPFTVRSGNIYFVSTSGNDTSGTGSISSPWKTIPKAKNTIAPGDIAYILNGVTQTAVDDYNACVSISSAGTSGKPKALVAYPGATVTIGSTSGTCQYAMRTPSISGGPFSYWTIAGFTIVGGGNQVLDLTSVSNWRVVANDMTCPNSPGGQAACWESSVTSTYLYAYGNHLHNFPSGDKQYHGFYYSSDTNFVWIGWNSIHDGGCRGIQFNSTSGQQQHDLHVHDNVIYNIRCDGINFSTIDPSVGPVEAYNNVIYNSGLGPDYSTQGASNYSCIASPGYVEAGHYGSGTVQVYNNTLYHCSSRTNTQGTTAQGAIILEANSPNMQLRNNIIYQLSSDVAYFDKSNTSNISLASGSNNLCYGLGACPSQISTNSLSADPKFVSTTTPDFHLQAGSPALGAGVSISSLLQSIDGIVRPGSGMDIGAYQYTAGTTTTYSPCDLNTDGVVNSTDVTLMTNLVLNSPNCGSADLTGTGTCTVVDVQRVIVAALGGVCKTGQ